VAQAAEICRNLDVELGKLATIHLLNIPGQFMGTVMIGMENMEFLNLNLSVFHGGLTEKEAEVHETLMKT
jgi:hypothetical protein